MRIDTLDDIRRLADEVAAVYPNDSRPEWLKAMPGAVHPGEAYYLFMFLLAQALPISRCLEIGTRGGTAAIHLALGLSMKKTPSRVVTVDIDPGCGPNVKKIAADNSLYNIEAVTGDSTRIDLTGDFDLLFIDGDHTYVASYGDYVRFRRLVRDGGLIVFDDTRLNPGMTQAWNMIADPKIELPQLHYMGFGVAIKSNSVVVPA